MLGETASRNAQISGAQVQGDLLVVYLEDGRIIATPIAWYPRLLNAAPEQRMQFEVSGGGYGLHWPELDEDLSVQGMLRGELAPWPVTQEDRAQRAAFEAREQTLGLARSKARRWAIQMRGATDASHFPSQQFQDFAAQLFGSLPSTDAGDALTAAEQEARATWKQLGP